MNLNHVRSPIRYIGCKKKILDDILPLFPKDCGQKTFIDAFCGSGTVSLNVPSSHLVLNDSNTLLLAMLNWLYEHSEQDICSRIDARISEFGLSSINKEGFEKFRSCYNTGDRSPIDLYILAMFSFNSYIRFNSAHEFNASFGGSQCMTPDTAKQRIAEYKRRLDGRTVEFMSYDFAGLYERIENPASAFWYFDPPYLASKAPYNDGSRGFKDWKAEDDARLFSMCDSLDRAGAQFALSNVMFNKGIDNKPLAEWAKGYQVYHISNTYANACYNADRSGCDEVLVTNVTD